MTCFGHARFCFFFLVMERNGRYLALLPFLDVSLYVFFFFSYRPCFWLIILSFDRNGTRGIRKNMISLLFFSLFS